ncbi:MAG: hypothetical protein V1676_00150 [Candidatus Diapherotrites archaeon]
MTASNPHSKRGRCDGGKTMNLFAELKTKAPAAYELLVRDYLEHKSAELSKGGAH